MTKYTSNVDQRIQSLHREVLDYIFVFYELFGNLTGNVIRLLVDIESDTPRILLYTNDGGFNDDDKFNYINYDLSNRKQGSLSRNGLGGRIATDRITGTKTGPVLETYIFSIEEDGIYAHKHKGYREYANCFLLDDYNKECRKFGCCKTGWTEIRTEEQKNKVESLLSELNLKLDKNTKGTLKVIPINIDSVFYKQITENGAIETLKKKIQLFYNDTLLIRNIQQEFILYLRNQEDKSFGSSTGLKIVNEQEFINQNAATTTVTVYKHNENNKERIFVCFSTDYFNLEKDKGYEIITKSRTEKFVEIDKLPEGYDKFGAYKNHINLNAFNDDYNYYNKSELPGTFIRLYGKVISPRVLDFGKPKNGITEKEFSGYLPIQVNDYDQETIDNFITLPTNKSNAEFTNTGKKINKAIINLVKEYTKNNPHEDYKPTEKTNPKKPRDEFSDSVKNSILSRQNYCCNTLNGLYNNSGVSKEEIDVSVENYECPLWARDGNGKFSRMKGNKNNTYIYEADHIIECREDGGNTEDNCQALCRDCHFIKTQIVKNRIKIKKRKKNTQQEYNNNDNKEIEIVNEDVICAEEKANRPPIGFAKPVSVSDELCDFLDKPHGHKIARTEVTKFLSAYIKKHNLQDNKNKRNIIPDDKFKSLLSYDPKYNSSEQLTYFNIQKYMKHHFKKS